MELFNENVTCTHLSILFLSHHCSYGEITGMMLLAHPKRVEMGGWGGGGSRTTLIVGCCPEQQHASAKNSEAGKHRLAIAIKPRIKLHQIRLGYNNCALLMATITHKSLRH